MRFISGSLASHGASPLKTTGSPLPDAYREGKSWPSPKITALIADDEPVAREALHGFLRHEPDVEVIGTSKTGREAADAINQLGPDLVFLDVHMPELNGFEVLREIRRPRMPAVIFVTSDGQSAARAFEVRATDYLVKPVRRERLQGALQRAREQLNQYETSQLSRKIESLVAGLREEPKASERIAIKSGGRIVFLRLADIDCIEAADNYVNLHTGQESHLLRETMNGLESRLSAKRFIRVSRSAIVNIEHIKELQPSDHGEYAVVLRNGKRLTLTRNYREKMRELSFIQHKGI